jgi:hypothetical protein
MKEIELLVTRNATVIDFESPQADEKSVKALLEQFALEYDPSSVTVCPAIKTRSIEGLPRSSSDILFWRAVWLHESEKPPSDFEICECSMD